MFRNIRRLLYIGASIAEHIIRTIAMEAKHIFRSFKIKGKKGQRLYSLDYLLGTNFLSKFSGKNRKMKFVRVGKREKSFLP